MEIFSAIGGFLETVSHYWVSMLPNYLVALVVLILFVPLYLLFSGIALVAVFAENVFKKLAGIDTLYLNGTAYSGGNGNGQDLVYAFVTNSAVQNVFFSIVALSFVLLFIFTIVALIKAEFALDLKGSAKSPIIGRALRSLVNFILVPAVAIISIVGTNYLTKTVYDMFSTSDTSLATKCFQLGAYSANRVRRGEPGALIETESFYEYINSGEYLDGGSNPFTGTEEEVADKIDKAFLEDADYQLNFKRTNGWQKLKDSADGKYVPYQTVFLTYPGATHFSIFHIDKVNYFYNLIFFDYVLAIGTAVVMAWTLLTVCLVLVKRAFELTILFILAPVMTAIAPLDGGQAEKKWRQEFMKRLLAVIAPIFAFNMYFLLVPLFEGISLFTTTTVKTVSDHMLIFNIFFELVCILTGLSVVKSASALLSNLLGIEDLVKSGGEAAKKAVDMGKKVALGATAMGGVAVKGAASAFKMGKGAVDSMRNKAGRLQKKEDKAKAKLDEAKEMAEALPESEHAQAKLKEAQEAYDEAEKANRDYKNDKADSARIKAGKKFEKERDRVGNEIELIDQRLATINSPDYNGPDAEGEREKLLTKRDKYQKLYNSYTESERVKAEEAAEKKSNENVDKKRKQPTGVLAGMHSGWNEEWGEDSDKTGAMAQFATWVDNKAQGAKNIPILGARLTKTTNAFKEQFAIKGSEVATRRLNDALAGLFGEGGGGELWKINFNKNSRASLFEGVPESKMRESGIQQNLLMGARDKYTDAENAKKAREAEEKIIRRMLGEKDSGLAALYKQREQAEKDGANPTEIKTLNADISTLEVTTGIAAEARSFYDDIAKGDDSKQKQLEAYKEKLDAKASIDAAEKEQKIKEKREKALADAGIQHETKLADESLEKIIQKLQNSALKTTLDKESLKSFTASFNNINTGFTSLTDVINKLIESLKKGGTGDDNGGFTDGGGI